MRVISGTAKSLKLKTVDGMDTRPTQDRIKETLFNMISSDVGGTSFLDLFSGSGGIRAISEFCSAGAAGSGLKREPWSIGSGVCGKKTDRRWHV